MLTWDRYQPKTRLSVALPALVQYRRPQLFWPTSTDQQFSTGSRSHTHTQTHAWVRGNGVKTGLNITHGGFLSWPTWLFCCLLFFLNINFTVQSHFDRQILIQNFKDYKVYSAHWSAEWNVRLFVLPSTEVYFRVSLPPPRRQSSKMMEHFFWLPPHFLRSSLLQLVFSPIKDSVAVLFGVFLKFKVVLNLQG